MENDTVQCKRTSGKINMVVEDCVALDAVAKRQKSWVERGDGTAPVAWRPVKLGRQGARAWLTAIDNQLKTSTCCRGLVDFNWTAEWGDRWPTWRGLGLWSQHLTQHGLEESACPVQGVFQV